MTSATSTQLGVSLHHRRQTDGTPSWRLPSLDLAHRMIAVLVFSSTPNAATAAISTLGTRYVWSLCQGCPQANSSPAARKTASFLILVRLLFNSSNFSAMFSPCSHEAIVARRSHRTGPKSLDSSRSKRVQSWKLGEHDTIARATGLTCPSASCLAVSPPSGDSTLFMLD
jgi:hypothetical protein